MINWGGNASIGGVRSRARTVMGVALVVVACTALALYVVLGHLAAQLATIQGTIIEFWSPSRIVKRALITFSLLAGLLYAVGTLERRKIVALYLRRFGKNTELLDPSDKGGLGKSIRLVTLQDNTFPPFAMSRMETALLVLMPFVVMSTIFVAINLLNKSALPVVSDNNAIFWDTHALYSHYVAWLASTVVLFAVGLRLRLRLQQTVVVSCQQHISHVERVVYQLSSLLAQPSLLGIRSTVVETADPLWKEAVARLLGVAQVAVIDVSELSESVLWELGELVKSDIPAVLIGNDAGFAKLEQAASQHNSVQIILSKRFDRYPRLAFEGGRGLTLYAYRKEVAELLRKIARPRSALQAPTASARASTAALLRHLSAAIAAGAIAGLLGMFLSEGVLRIVRYWMP